ncbi:hypothetical protein HPP92_012197 [Vanilla planifolia]|uniref:F-box domain-containing protein n=1 Tax=Vanilla planifolia TaxID=51239 RepID=A0A835QZ19_VANPL|nr:hypothetical protein HPP92_012197 [Vanilla planifolia]
MESRSWEEMEMDCLVHIFTRLGLEDLCLTLPLVCKSWLAAVKEPLCWKKLDFRRLDLLPWSDFSKKFSKQYSLPYFSFSCLLRLALKRSCGSVSELRLPLKHVSIDDLLLASLKMLERLKLDECIGFDGEDGEVLEKASAVKFFSNRGCKLYYEHVDDYFCGCYSYGYIL